MFSYSDYILYFSYLIAVILITYGSYKLYMRPLGKLAPKPPVEPEP